jgi:hypothetical protein
MNPHRVGGGAGQDGRPSHDTESPTLAFIPTPDLADQRTGGASTELARIVSPHTKELEPATHAGGGAEGSTDGSSRAGTVIAGELRVAVNAPDGSSATECPPDQRPQPVPAPVDPTFRPRTVSGLLERDALCERLRGQLLEGRSVRLIGEPGSGRSVILDAVAGACSGLAPAGVIQLSGCFRTPADLLQDLFAAAYDAPGYRPGRALVPEIMHDLCAIVVIDDVEFGGEALEELIAAAPESSFLLSSTPAARTGGWRTAGFPDCPGSPRSPCSPVWPDGPWTTPSGPGRSTSGSSRRACRCASSRPQPCSGTASPPSRRWRRSPPTRTGPALRRS